MVVVVEGESDEEQSGLIKGQELEWNKSNYVRTSEGCLDRGTDRRWIRRDEMGREGEGEGAGETRTDGVSHFSP